MDAERERKRERAWGIWKASIRSFAQRWVFIWKIEIIFTSSSALYQTVIEFYSEITVFLLFAEIRSSNCISTRLDSRSVFLSVSALVFLSLSLSLLSRRDVRTSFRRPCTRPTYHFPRITIPVIRRSSKNCF